MYLCLSVGGREGGVGEGGWWSRNIGTDYRVTSYNFTVV